jgi:predicted phage-related endonuclease
MAGPAKELKGVASLEHGNETEGMGLGRYKWENGEVEQTGFIVHPRFDFCGGSPDALVGTEGGVEVKAPFNRDVQTKTVVKNEMPAEHISQVQGLMWITGRSWWDYVSVAPVLPHPWDYFVKRIERDDEYIAQLEVKVCEFEESILAAIAAVTERNET